MGQTAEELVGRLGDMSLDRAWDPYTSFDWPESLDPEAEHYMSPELVSLYGTDTFNSLSEVEKKRLSFYEIGNFFSFVLLGERPVVGGMTERMYRKDTMGPITDYLHHFIDEENKHMVMFNRYCMRYLGRIYPEKKLMIDRPMANGEADLVFYCRVLIVEELGDVYNRKMMADDRINGLVQQINEYHHRDEARHLAFGRAWAAELFERYTADWTEEQLSTFQNWLAQYFKSSWSDFYNPTVYKDAGIENAYQVRQEAMSHPIQVDARQLASRKLMNFFVKHGFLAEAAIV